LRLKELEEAKKNEVPPPVQAEAESGDPLTSFINLEPTDVVRPNFKVVKPYFCPSKTLKEKNLQLREAFFKYD
jgi:hypothetical protein